MCQSLEAHKDSGQQLLRHATLLFIGTGKIVAFLKLVGTSEWISKRLKMSANAYASLSAQNPRMLPGTPTSLLALRGFTLKRPMRTPAYLFILTLTKRQEKLICWDRSAREPISQMEEVYKYVAENMAENKANKMKLEPDKPHGQDSGEWLI